MRNPPVRQNLWELAVLAFLREMPMHPYEMQRLLSERHKDELLVLKRGSLYHAIDRLLRLELIEALQTAPHGRRPARTTYKITPAGRAALKHWLLDALSIPLQESSEFMAALSFLVHLTPQEAIPKLEKRVRALEEVIADLEQLLPLLVTRIKRINLIETEYLCAMRKAELEWVRNLVSELSSGRFEWDFKTIVREAHAEQAPAPETGK